MPPSAPTIHEEIDAAIQWWRAAGVDQDFDADATVWLSQSKPADEQSSPKPDRPSELSSAQSAEKAAAENSSDQPVNRIILGDQPPADLESFRDWWLTEPGLDQIGPRGRIAPHGSQEPQLMVLVVDPEPQDKDTLLSGPGGTLLSNFLRACEIDQSDVYFASALTRHTPMADTKTLAKSGMSEILHHHISLVQPKRLLAFGGNILPLIGNDVPKNAKNLREINSTAPNTPLLMSEGLDSLMASPRLKARFWRSWLEWSADE